MLRARYLRFFSLPSAVFPLSDLKAFCAVIRGLFSERGPDKFEITFCGANGQPLIAELPEDISADDVFVPDAISDPAIVASKNDARGNVMNAIRIERAFGGYRLALEGSDPSWLVHADRIIAWLKVRRTWYAARLTILIPAALLVGISIIAAAHSGHSDPRDPNVTIITNRFMFYLGLVGIVAGALLAVVQDSLFPHITVVVRQKAHWSLNTLVLILTAVGLVVGIVFDVWSMTHK